MPLANRPEKGNIRGMRYAIGFIVGLALSLLLIIALMAVRSYLDARRELWIENEVELSAAQELLYRSVSAIADYGYLLALPLMLLCFFVAKRAPGKR